MRNMREIIFETIGLFMGFSLVLSMIVYVVVALTITQGYYNYREVEIKQSDNGILYAVYNDGESYWEKQIDEPIMRVTNYSSFAEVDTINVYRLEDEVFEKYRLLVRDTWLFQISDKYYVRENLFQRIR